MQPSLHQESVDRAVYPCRWRSTADGISTALVDLFDKGLDQVRKSWPWAQPPPWTCISEQGSDPSAEGAPNATAEQAASSPENFRAGSDQAFAKQQLRNQKKREKKKRKEAA